MKVAESLTVNLSLACFPAMPHHEALLAAINMEKEGALIDPLFGDLSMSHIQIVPQNIGVMDEVLAHVMKETFPKAQFRLHANVRVLPKRGVYDLANAREFTAHFEQAARIQRELGSNVYSAHAGYRKDATLAEMFDNVRWLMDLFGQHVAIEGLYPDRFNSQLMATWDEYKQLLDSGLPFALDLSHLNIVAHKSRRREVGLVQEMLSSEQCLEIHVSDNDGSGDQHQKCDADRTPWWLPLLHGRNPKAVIFSEGNLRRSIR